jgi:hypothetical protein
LAVTATPIFPQAIRNAVLTLTNSSGETITTLYTAGSNGSKIENLLVTSTDTSARDVSLYFVISSTDYLVGTVSIPATSGSADSVPTVNLLASANLPGFSRDANGNPYLYLGSTTTLAVGALTTITSGKQIQFIAQGGDY